MGHAFQPAEKSPSRSSRGTSNHGSAIMRQPAPESQNILQPKAGCACGGGCPRCQEQLPIQKKLAISEPGDPYEQEADRIADEVMRMPAHPEVNGLPRRIQRFTAQAMGQAEAAPSVDQVLASPGNPLKPMLRQDMEQRFGYDFSRVRVHSGAVAEQSARDVNAHAYTVGQNIVFGAGRFAPGTNEGRRLVAHELTHVLQNNACRDRSIIRREEQGIYADKAPKGGNFRVVFYRSGHLHSPSFHGYATKIASELGATKFDNLFSADPEAEYPMGALPCARESNVFEHVRLWWKKLGRQADQLHVIGHIPSEGPNCMPVGGPTKAQKEALTPNVKIVLHGCAGCGNYKGGWKGILQQLPDAQLYAHTQSAEAGGPLNFARVSLDENGDQVETPVEDVIGEDIGFSERGVVDWAMTHLQNLKAKGADDAGWSTIEMWLTTEEFKSRENGILAEAIYCDPDEDKIDKDVLDAARTYLSENEVGDYPYTDCDVFDQKRSKPT